jgi:hypothetical protein
MHTDFKKYWGIGCRARRAETQAFNKLVDFKTLPRTKPIVDLQSKDASPPAGSFT